jgi:hypothetical protein
LINEDKTEIEKIYSDSGLIFDEVRFQDYFKIFYNSLIFIFYLQRCCLIHSMNHLFCQNFKTQQFPSHLISFRKQDLLNIKHISKAFANIREVNLSFTSNYSPKPETLSKSNYCFMYLVMFNVLN